jgi:hypothetical protein
MHTLGYASASELGNIPGTCFSETCVRAVTRKWIDMCPVLGLG